MLRHGTPHHEVHEGVLTGQCPGNGFSSLLASYVQAHGDQRAAALQQLTQSSNSLATMQQHSSSKASVRPPQQLRPSRRCSWHGRVMQSDCQTPAQTVFVTPDAGIQAKDSLCRRCQFPPCRPRVPRVCPKDAAACSCRRLTAAQPCCPRCHWCQPVPAPEYCLQRHKSGKQCATSRFTKGLVGHGASQKYGCCCDAKQCYGMVIRQLLVGSQMAELSCRAAALTCVDP